MADVPEEGTALLKIGLVVNPIAGIGGSVGLKGSDGLETLERARALGGVPRAPGRAVEALRELAKAQGDVGLVTYPEEMGAKEAREAGLQATVIGTIVPGQTTALDTRRAARAMAGLGVGLLLFAGGDGTARDVYDAVGDGLAVLGIPAGAKIHSAAYAISPRMAGELAARWVRGALTRLVEAEVLDVDEEVMREQDRVATRLYGYLRIPFDPHLTQGPKRASGGDEAAALEGIARRILEGMDPRRLYVVGPGTTTRALVERLGLRKTLLGVDVVQAGRLIGSDVNAAQLLRLVEGREAVILVTPIGGQGYVFGRGNQQISPEVIRRVGAANVVVVATPGKIAALGLKPLLVDTGDEAVDAMLRGYIKVVTGYQGDVVYKVT